MFKHRRMAVRPEKPVVLSWLARVDWQEETPSRGSFEVLVRHLFARLLSSVSLDAGDDASVSGTAQVAYAAALPTLLFALYLFPAYHQPFGKPGLWVQATHHFFYVDASFATMGLATVLLWDGIFPDALDALILTHLPIAGRRMLAARVVALVIFLGGILLGMSLLGILFFPAVAELPGLFIRHVFVHAFAVLTSGLCAIFSVVALQGIVVCCSSQRWGQILSTVFQSACVLFFTMLLILEPLISHLLPSLLSFSSSMLRWFPPFWFLGLYEHLLLHAGAPPVFAPLAKSGLVATALVMLVSLVTYPAAHDRRTRQVIEGVDVPTRSAAPSLLLAELLGHTVLRDSRGRAIFLWISQTLPRTRRTRLLLAFIAALILAAPLSVLLLRLVPATHAGNWLIFEVAHLAIPATAFFTITGLRTAFHAPVAQRGAWAFRVIHGRPDAAHRLGAEVWAAVCGCSVTTLTALLIYQVIPPALRDAWSIPGQVLIGALLSVLLADLLFLQERATPFTEPRASTVNDLSFTVVLYFVLFPVSALAFVSLEAWAEVSQTRGLLVLLIAVLTHGFLRLLHTFNAKGAALGTGMEEEALLPGEIGLRDG